MKQIEISMKFHQCKYLIKNNFKLIVETVFEGGFIFEQNMNGLMHIVRKKEEIENLVNKHFRIWEVSETDTSQPTRWSVIFNAYPDNIGSFQNGFLEMKQFDIRTNRLTIGGLIDFEVVDQRHLVEPYAQMLKDVAIALYPIVLPEFGSIDNDDTNITEKNDVARFKVPFIGWINFWGPSYVNKYGKKFFLGMPGYETNTLPDGGIFHQLTPYFVAEKTKEVREIRHRVIDYCAKNGLKVNCYAPYSI